MATWNPPSAVGEVERIGRRLFEKPNKPRQKRQDGRPLLEVNDFYDNRSDDLSVDRLGDPNPSKDTLRAITELADNDAQHRNPPLCFGGWATITVRDLKWPGWVASIVPASTRAEAESKGNPWHAGISRSGFTEKSQAYAFATTLRDIFERKGAYSLPVRSGA